jgi:hypothetical protein
MRANRSPGPSNRPQVTKHAHRHEGQQLDHRFGAMAATMPSWRSVVSRWRVPKAMVKPASTSAMYSVLSPTRAPPAPAPAAGQQRVAAGDGLELQRHVGHHADQRDQRHQPGQRRLLP